MIHLLAPYSKSEGEKCLTIIGTEGSRTVIRFLTHRIRMHELFEYVDVFVQLAEKMPHGADYLARLFRESETWRDLEEWYTDFSKESKWASLDWSVASFCRMFPRSYAGQKAIAQHFGEVLSAGPKSLAVAALAAQRLSTWVPVDARAAIREAAKNAENPLLRRVLALAALEAREERSFLRRLLNEFEENAATLKMLEENDFRPLPVVPDFIGK